MPSPDRPDQPHQPAQPHQPDQPELVTIDRDGAVSTLTLRRPERRNAIDLRLARSILAAATAEVEAGARVLVVTGEGTAFCAGADLGGVYGEEFLEALYGMLHGLTRLPVPIVAAVNGPAIGAGTQLALACDLRVAGETARFAVPTARNGMAVDAWTIRALADVAGGGVARRLMLAAETLGRDEALACGLADRPGDLAVAQAWAAELAELAPLTLAYNKLVLETHAHVAETTRVDDPAGDEAQIAAGFAACWASADVREAATARIEKRTPVFTGR